MAEKKKPLSLNERHRLLSASHNKPARSPSNLPEQEKPQPVMVKVEGRRRLFKAASSIDDSTSDEPNFGIMDFDSPLTKVGGGDKAAVDDQPSFSGIMDFDSPLTKTRDNGDDPNYKVEEKTKVDNFEPIYDSSEESVDQLGGRDGNGDLNEGYDSAGSSFSVSPVANTRAHSASAENATEEDSFVDCEILSNPREGEVAKSRAHSASAKNATEEDSFVDSVISSNSQEEEKSQKAEFEGKQPLRKISPKDNSATFSGPKFSLITDFDSPLTKIQDTGEDVSLKLEYILSEKKKVNRSETIPVTKEEAVNQIEGDGGVKQEYSSAVFSKVQRENSDDEDDTFVDRVTSLNPPEDNRQPQKVKKLKGRRRLCKISSEDVKGDDCGPIEESKFAGITDLDTPPNNIRDILNDLTSKLDYLSIEKKKVASFSGHPLPITKEEAPNQLKRDAKDRVKQKYDRAGSSFLFSPDQSLTTKSEIQNAKNEAEGYRFVACEGDAKKVDDSHKKAYSTTKKFQKPILEESFLVVSDEDEDPYLILSSGQSSKRTHTKSCRIKENVMSSISVDTPKDSGAGDWVFEDGESIIFSGKPSNYTLPGKIAKMLYPHQRSGLRWLWSLHCQGTGGILGDDMGLGKTMQICSFLAGLFHSGLIKRVMVVAPKTLLSHWSKELTVVGLSEKIREYFGSCAKARQYELQFIFQGTGILLTTYDIVRNNFKSLRGDSFFHDERSEDSITWDYTILDEGHIIKNPSTQRAKSLLEIPSGHRIIISGTPIQNNLKELWALFSFCCPELLGDKKEFKDRYESAILRGNDKTATDREKRIGSTVAKDLRDHIKPYFLRRLKNEVFCDDEATNSVKLSKKNEIIVWLRLTQCQRQLYEAFLNSELVLSSFDKSPLAALTVLKKICDHPYLLTKRAAEDVLEGMETMVNQDDLSILERMALHLANPSDSEDFQNVIDNVSCKITFILSLLDNLIPEGHNVLIFSQTRKMLNFVQEAIISRGYKFLRIDGTTKISDREKIVKDFQEGEGAPIFLLTSQVGGLGLTLTNADRVIVVDPAWNPSTDNQSVDRAYRIGQKKDVIVYRLMTCGTIEEKIYKMQVFKGGLFKTATEQKEQTRYFSQQDLRELFSLPKEGFDVSVTQRQLDEEHDQQHIMDDSLKKHIEFLESHDISGVSHHSLLFSKTAPAPAPVIEENEVLRRKETTFVGCSYSSSSVERNVDGSELALNPKDVKIWKKGTSSVSPNRLTKSEIRDRIERLHQTFANKAMMSKLPDKGEKLKRQIADLNLELEKISTSEDSATEIIDLDDISGKLQRIRV